MKKIMVTGGAGFIGSNLCERLVSLGHEVVSIDNYSTGSFDNHVKGVTYHVCDTLSIDGIKFVPDLIYHLGEYSRVESSFSDIGKVWSSNSTGTFKVLEFARSRKAKLVYAGSSTKFGDIGSNSSPYAFTKAKNTELVMNYGEWFNLDYAITYFYNVVGKNEIASGPYATLIAKFLALAKVGEKLPVTSPGTQVRNFTHIDDTIDGLILVGEFGKGDGYGMANDTSYSILDIAKMMNSEIIMTPEKPGNRMYAETITQKTKELGWMASRSIEKYISDSLI